ncbi:MAG: DUF3015 domain-containing protein [Bdellovibrionales bacterium]|nr:DUF3015 domain-containing protein [Bdellovibrionales bacterium]
MLRKLATLTVFFILSQAHANHYGMAGCGLGSLVFQDQPGKIQIVAATLNRIVSPQTSAITSGTSGCFEEGSYSAKLNYIETNMVSLKADAARGQGETLDGLITLMGCQNSVKGEFKTNYKKIFSHTQPKQVFEAIKSNDAVQKSCATVG